MARNAGRRLEFMKTGRNRNLLRCAVSVGLWILSLTALLWAASRHVASVKAAQASDKSPSGDYVGSETCSACHRDIYDAYKKTSMGHSMAEITPALLAAMQLPATYDDAKLNRHFSVYAQDGNLYQSEFETDASGKDVFRDVHQLKWKIGAGENGFGLLTDRDSYLFQAPLSFYSKAGAWGPSPGYEFADYGFSRPILTGCIVCHSGSPRPVASTNGRYEPKPFTEVAIGCERCHGPGAAHVQAMVTEAGRAAKDRFIVNPGRLKPELANNICMQCHQTGDVRVLQPGKNYADFRPGQYLNDTLAILKVPPTREAPPDEDHVEHYYSMTLSKCYRASAGRMSCISCHDPHIEPADQQAPAYFNSRCMTCHTDHSCRLALPARQHTTPANNCIGCHMPKRDIRVISHSSVTNHRILRKPGEAFPDITFQQTTASLPNLIHLNPFPASTGAPIPPLTLLQAYGELSENKPEYVAPYLKTLDQLNQSQPDNALVQAALGRKEIKSGNFSEAADHLKRSLELDPVQPAVAGDMADALQKLGKVDEATTVLKKAIGQDPFNPVLQKKLIVDLIAMRQYAEARAALEQYMKAFPQDTFMRQMLARVQGPSAAQ